MGGSRLPSRSGAENAKVISVPTLPIPMDIPGYYQSGSTSPLHVCINVRGFCERNPFVLTRLESKHFTWSVQCNLRGILDNFSDNDRCFLRQECERCYARFRDCDDLMYTHLVDFCEKQPEVLSAPGYAARHSWSSDMRAELRKCIDTYNTYNPSLSFMSLCFLSPQSPTKIYSVLL